MLKFQPGIARHGSVTEFPRPIQGFRIRDAWDFEKMKIPLLDGDQLVGHSRSGTEILLEGQIGQHTGSLKLSEPEMFSTLNLMRDALDVNESCPAFEFVLFADESTSEYRFFRDCTTVRFEFDLSEKCIYSFSAVIHAANPRIFTGELPA